MNIDLTAVQARCADLSLARAELERELAEPLRRLERLRVAEIEALGEYQRLKQQSSQGDAQ